MPFAWSWSALEGFETCPKKYYHTRIKKDYVEPDSEAQTWGKQVHDALANRINKARKLPETMPYEKHIEEVLKNSDRTLVSTKAEQDLAVTEDMTPCQFFDRRVDPWLRAKVDVLKVRLQDGIARIVDWKTGKAENERYPKYYPDPVTGKNVPTSDQLKLSAAIVMAHYPEIDVAWTQFVWVEHDVVTDEMVTRADLPKFWSKMLPRVDKMEQAYKTTEYLPKPGGLCKNHCPVTGCPYHGRGSY